MNDSSTDVFRAALRFTRDLVGILVIAVPVSLAVVRAQLSDRFEVASVKRVEIPVVSAGVPVFPVTDGIGTSNPRRITYHAPALSILIT